MKKIKVVLIGAGGRGTTYTNIMADSPDKFEVVAVVEPVDSKRNNIKKRHNIPENRCFTDWHPLFELGKIADMAIIATQDREHFVPAMEAIGLGYHLLLEKPIAPTADECNTLTAYAVEKKCKGCCMYSFKIHACFHDYQGDNRQRKNRGDNVNKSRRMCRKPSSESQFCSWKPA